MLQFNSHNCNHLYLLFCLNVAFTLLLHYYICFYILFTDEQRSPAISDTSLEDSSETSEGNYPKKYNLHVIRFELNQFNGNA